MESVGMLIGESIFFGLSLLLGVCFALATWRLLRGRRQARPLVLVAAMAPPLCAVYMVACVVLFPITWISGEIAEPLPHGYTLQAPGKMPDHGTIEVVSMGYGLRPQMQGWIGQVDLEGDTLFGRYSHAFEAETDKPKWCCFAFDTATGVVTNFSRSEEMNSFAGKRIATGEVQNFRNREPVNLRRMLMEKWVLFGPPAVVMLMLFGLLLYLRASTSSQPADRSWV